MAPEAYRIYLAEYQPEADADDQALQKPGTAMEVAS
jgi:hypothetical protein